MTQFADSAASTNTTLTINLVMSVFITCSAIVYMYTMDTFLPEVTNQCPEVVYIPTLVLLAMSMWLLVNPQPMEM